jgi:hypothetical protein
MFIVCRSRPECADNPDGPSAGLLLLTASLSQHQPFRGPKRHGTERCCEVGLLWRGAVAQSIAPGSSAFLFVCDHRKEGTLLGAL